MNTTVRYAGPTAVTFVLRAAQVPGGLKAEAGPLTSKVAEDFEAAR